MPNMLLKARAGRRVALMLRSVRKAGVVQAADQIAENPAAQRPVEHQFLKRVALSENRISKLSLA